MGWLPRPCVRTLDLMHGVSSGRTSTASSTATSQHALPVPGAGEGAAIDRAEPEPYAVSPRSASHSS